MQQDICKRQRRTIFLATTCLMWQVTIFTQQWFPIRTPYEHEVTCHRHTETNTIRFLFEAQIAALWRSTYLTGLTSRNRLSSCQFVLDLVIMSFNALLLAKGTYTSYSPTPNSFWDSTISFRFFLTLFRGYLHYRPLWYVHPQHPLWFRWTE